MTDLEQETILYILPRELKRVARLKGIDTDSMLLDYARDQVMDALVMAGLGEVNVKSPRGYAVLWCRHKIRDALRVSRAGSIYQHLRMLGITLRIGDDPAQEASYKALKSEKERWRQLKNRRYESRRNNYPLTYTLEEQIIEEIAHNTGSCAISI
jgi:hypothetical protein